MTTTQEAEQEYQAHYYETVTKPKRRKQNQWREDPEYREKEQARARRRRALQRAKTADERFDAMVAEKKAKKALTQAPRYIYVDDVGIRLCFVTGSLARETGRGVRTVQAWLDEEVLPGATQFLGEKKLDAFFSAEYCAAIKRALRRLYRLDGRAPHSVLRRLIAEEMERGNISYIPVGGSRQDRVWLGPRPKQRRRRRRTAAAS